MKQVLGILGSPRRGGNCEIMVREISRQLATPHHLRLLRLPDFALRHCTGCYRCLGGEACVLDDELATVLGAIAEADALVLAAPAYFLGAHACLKLFVDRGISFYAMADKLWGKPAVGLAIAGIAGKEGSTLLDIERFLLTLQADLRDTRVIYAALPGEAALGEAGRQAAAELAAALESGGCERPEPCCPLCGGATIRFLADGRVRCMLCSNSGRLVEGPEGLRLDIVADDHAFVADQNAALRHRDWLEGMLARYAEQRTALKAVKAAYRDEVEWVRPKRGEKGA